MMEARCGACHRGRESFPPGFLRGTPAQAKLQVIRCAPRILHRLKMWDVPIAKRTKSPMPPGHTLAAMGFDEVSWRQSGSLAALRNYVSALAPDVTGDEAYVSLPPCGDAAQPLKR
jgi:hypothetical protein